MNAVNAVLMFILVWTFTAVCQADKDVSVSCDVTGSVGKEITFTCRVSLLINECCIKNNKFTYNDKIICKREPPVGCEKNKTLTCRHTPTTKYAGTFSFFVQTSCGWNETEFTVDISDNFRDMNLISSAGTSPPKTAADLGLKDTIIVVASSLIIIFLIIIIIRTVIYKTKPNFIKLSGVYNSDHKHYVI